MYVMRILLLVARHAKQVICLHNTPLMDVWVTPHKKGPNESVSCQNKDGRGQVPILPSV